MWTGELEPCDEALELALGNFVREQRWTGGGEIEAIEDSDGQVTPCDTSQPLATPIPQPDYVGFID